MRSMFLVFAFAAFCVAATAQDASKPWGEWSKKDAERILNESAWGQTYVQEGAQASQTSAITATSASTSRNISNQGESGESRPSRTMKFRARFLTAKPVREAFARVVVLQQPNASAELKTQLQGFIDRDFGDFLVVSFSIEADDERMTKGAMMGLGRLTAETLKDKVYLERKDGKRATLTDYRPPTEDGMGAKFIFSRTLDGQPFLVEDADFVKFFFQLSDKQKVTMKYKVSAMTYGGKLEY